MIMKAIIIIAIISGEKLLPIHLIITIITIYAESFARQSLPTSGKLSQFLNLRKKRTQLLYKKVYKSIMKLMEYMHKKSVRIACRFLCCPKYLLLD